MLKKILAIACTIFMLCGMTAFALEADTVLEPTVVNGDFSEGTTMWFGSQGGKVTAGTDEYAGTLQVTSTTGGATSHAEQNITFDFEPGISYTLEVKACNPAVNGVRATGYLGAYNYTTYGFLKTAANTDCKATINSETWTTYTLTFTVPAKEDGTTNLQKLGIWLANTGENAKTIPIYFDDVKLYETPILVNGGFEKGSTGYYTGGSGTGGVSLIQDATQAHSGNNCMQINRSTAKHFYFASSLQQNTTYKLTYWFKYNAAGGGNGAAWPVVEVKSSGNVVLNDGTSYATEINGVTADTWIKRTHYFKTAEVEGGGTSNVYIKFLGASVQSTAYYDDVAVEKASTEIELHDMNGENGTDVTNLSALAANASLYAKGRFVPKTVEASAMLIAVVFDESQGKKQLEYIDIKPYSTTTGAATTLELTISGYESFAGKAVEVYLWDSTTGLDALAKKVRRSQSATQ